LQNSPEQLLHTALASHGQRRCRLLVELRQAIKRARPELLTKLDPQLPALARCLYDTSTESAAQCALNIFRSVPAGPATTDALINMQRAQPNALVIKALGYSSRFSDSAGYAELMSEALANEETAVAAAEILFRSKQTVSLDQSIQSLTATALQTDPHTASAAISKLISHTESERGELARDCLLTVLHRSDVEQRAEIAAKLEWSSRRGLGILNITACDKSASVRLATANALLRAYRIRGRTILAKLAADSDHRVRNLVSSALQPETR
jgi:hypothetical protein